MAKWDIKSGAAGYLNPNQKEEQHTMLRVIESKDLDTAKFGKVRHILMHTDEEPDIEEKYEVLKNTGFAKKVAIEVFPANTDFANSSNTYHMWEMEDEKSFPFDMKPIFFIPEAFEDITVKDVYARYAMNIDKTQYGKVAYLYFFSENELKRSEKQALKDEIVGEYVTAVEVINEFTRSLFYCCMVCLPMNYKLDF